VLTSPLNCEAESRSLKTKAKIKIGSSTSRLSSASRDDFRAVEPIGILHGRSEPVHALEGDIARVLRRNHASCRCIVHSDRLRCVSDSGVSSSRWRHALKTRRSCCELLSRELVIKVSGAVNKLVFDLPPEEEPAGNGTACHYADITLQIDTFTPDRLEQMRKTAEKEWAPVSGVGDAASFRNNRNRFAELIGRVGAHSFTIQLGVPFQGSAESMKPNVIALANAITPKLR
jgi:hypothetical protein